MKLDIIFLYYKFLVLTCMFSKLSLLLLENFAKIFLLIAIIILLKLNFDYYLSTEHMFLL